MVAKTNPGEILLIDNTETNVRKILYQRYFFATGELHQRDTLDGIREQ